MAIYAKVGDKYYTVGERNTLQQITPENIVGRSGSQYTALGQEGALQRLRAEKELLDINPADLQVEQYTEGQGTAQNPTRVLEGQFSIKNLELGGLRPILRSAAEFQALGLTPPGTTPAGGSVPQDTSFQNYLQQTGQTYNTQTGKYSGSPNTPNPNVSEAEAQRINTPKAQPAPQTPVQAANFTPPQATNANNQVYKVFNPSTNNWDVFELGTNRHIELSEFQQKGFNVDHINTQEVLQRGQQEGQGGTGDGSSGVGGILQKYGITPPTPSDNPITSFSDTYKKLLTDLGVPDIKSRLDEINKKYGDLQNELNDKIADVNENPWLSEAARSDEIQSLQSRYKGKLGILTNQQKLYDSLYQQAVEEAKFVSQTAFKQQEFNVNTAIKLQQLALDQQEAMRKLVEIDPAQFKEVQNGLYNIKTGEWVVPPKVTATETSITKDYTEEINSQIKAIYNGLYGTQGSREKAIARLQGMFPGKDVAKDIYERVPDGYEQNITPKPNASASKSLRLQELLLKSNNGQNLDLLNPLEQAELYSLI